MFRSALIMLVGALFGSCSTTKAAGTMIVDGEEITYSAEVESNVNDIEVDHTLVSQTDGRVAAQFEIENEDDFPIRVHITWDWLDVDGIALRKAAGESSDRYEVIAGDEKRLITIQSPTEGAVTVKIKVRSIKSTL
ncbi:MAG: DUF1425 domain-containing protein [Planctomycetes bacterium]|nr:DUF1425 domain-containing protein [Planctomycetota bacterium]